MTMAKPRASDSTEQSPAAPANFDASFPLPPKRKLWRYLFVLILLGLAIYFFLSRYVAVERAAMAVTRLRMVFVAFAFVAEVFSYLGSGYLLSKAVRLASKPVSVTDGALITAGANSVGTLGGGVIGTAGMTFFWLRRRGVNPGAAGLGGWLPIILDNTVLAVLSLVGLLVLVHLRKSVGILAAGFGLVGLFLGTLILGFIVFVTHKDWLEPVARAIAGFVGRIRRRPAGVSSVKAAVDRFLQGWNALLQGGWHGPVLGALLNSGFDILTMACLFYAARYPIGATILVAGYGVPQLLGKLTIVFGGVGVIEASMIGLFSILGVPRGTSVVVVLAYRMVSFWLPTLIGILLIPYLNRRGMSSP